MKFGEPATISHFRLCCSLACSASASHRCPHRRPNMGIPCDHLGGRVSIFFSDKAASAFVIRRLLYPYLHSAHVYAHRNPPALLYSFPPSQIQNNGAVCYDNNFVTLLYKRRFIVQSAIVYKHGTPFTTPLADRSPRSRRFDAANSRIFANRHRDTRYALFGHIEMQWCGTTPKKTHTD